MAGDPRPGHRPSPAEELRDALCNPRDVDTLRTVVEALPAALLRQLADLINGARVETLRAYARAVEIEQSRIRAERIRVLTHERFGGVTRHG